MIPNGWSVVAVFVVALTTTAICLAGSDNETASPMVSAVVPDRVTVSVQETGSLSKTGDLAGTSWQLVDIKSMDDHTYTPKDPARYKLEFVKNGSVRIQADCNRGMGSWASESRGQLSFGDIATTRALCPPDSLHDRYLEQFQWVRSYVIEKGHLFLATMADGSIVEFSPVPDKKPVAIVLGEPIEAVPLEEVKSIILTRLLERYATGRGIEVSASEVDAYVEKLERVKKRDRITREKRVAELKALLESGGLSDDERESLLKERESQVELLELLASGSAESLAPEELEEASRLQREMAKSTIWHWKVNGSLHDEYGGRIIYQQFGPEPLDAYRQFLEKQQREGAFSLRDKEVESSFWRYFTDDTMHSFYAPGSREEAMALSVPPWGEMPNEE